jgi:hypothetical protein
MHRDADHGREHQEGTFSPLFELDEMASCGDGPRADPEDSA